MLGIEYAKGGGVYEVKAERRWKRWNLLRLAGLEA
jgi:hypothetical protein